MGTTGFPQAHQESFRADTNSFGNEDIVAAKGNFQPTDYTYSYQLGACQTALLIKVGRHLIELGASKYLTAFEYGIIFDDVAHGCVVLYFS
jgi:hypothetical protein